MIKYEIKKHRLDISVNDYPSITRIWYRSAWSMMPFSYAMRKTKEYYSQRSGQRIYHDD